MSDLTQIHLVLLFTKGVSLKTWDEIGMLEREVALYRRLRTYLGGLAFVTYGDAGDLAYARRLPGIDILCNEQNLSLEEYAHAIPELHQPHLARATILKTNQVLSAEVAMAVKQRYGQLLITRCGYLWADFARWATGAELDYARRACEVERLAFTQADRAVVTTPAMQYDVSVTYGLPSERISLIPNYVQTDLFRPLPHLRPIAGRICYIGREASQKNLPALFEAMAGLPIELILIGGAGQSEALRQKAAQLELKVQFRGNLPHAALPTELNQAELFILPSLWEGHPKVLLEAMACGRPVIGTDVPGIRELIVHGQNGYLCQPDPASLRAAVETLLGNKDLQAHLGQRARALVEDYFSLERILKLELALLQQVAPVPAKPGLGQRLRTWLNKPQPSPSVETRVDQSSAVPVAQPASPLDKAASLASEATAYTHALPPAEALRFLFELETRLYPLQGQKAVEYGGGIHTKHRHMRYHDFFVQRVKPGERVLDIGCGNGAVAYDMAAMGGAEITGIDLAEPNIAQARQKHGHARVRYLVGDALTDLPKERFEVIVMSNVLEHLEHRVEFLSQVQTRYQPERWLIRVPLFERDWRVPLKQELGLDYRLDPTHFIEYTQESFASEVEQAGLKIIYQEIRWGEIWAELRVNDSSQS
ncbi:MAG: hypothetical protein BroJett011_45900 [Chloroflexota bacterium]|nr:MAG: hypothetical protein BroJett011_45900 [Chloroflexota bacterium]